MDASMFITLSDEDRNTILSLLRREVATLNDDGGACKRLVELFEKARWVEVALSKEDYWKHKEGGQG